MILKCKIGRFLDGEFYTSVTKVVMSSLIMGGAIGALNFILPWANDASFEMRTFFLIAAITTGLVVFAGSSYLMKSSEMVTVLATLKRKVGRR